MRMLSIGIRNLRRAPLRMAMAILGVVFAVVLICIEVGMLLGMVESASNLIDRSRADIWVCMLDVRTFDFATPLSQRKKFMIEALPGVEKVEEFNVSYSIWKLPTGGNANCQVIAYDLKGDLAAPLNLAEGDAGHLHNQAAVIVDLAERRKLGNPRVGEMVEVMGQRAKVVGFTQGMTSFTTTPYVFTALPNGNKYGWLTTSANPTGGDQMSIYFLVKVKAGADVARVCRSIEDLKLDLEAHTREAFSLRTRKYWLLEMGVGIGFMVAAFLGLAVGGVIVSQTLYTLTIEKLPEFAILKALGGGMWDVGRVVLEQGLVCGLLGLFIGLAISFLVSGAATAAGTTVLITWPLVLGVSLVTLLLSLGAAVLSIHRLRYLEPASVMRA